MKLEPIAEHTRRDMIADRLRDHVVSSQVRRGLRLTEADLSEQLGVSRISPREAIQQLVATGLLVSVPYKGLFVRDFAARDLEELYSLRTALEKFAFRQCWAGAARPPVTICGDATTVWRRRWRRRTIRRVPLNLSLICTVRQTNFPGIFCFRRPGPGCIPTFNSISLCISGRISAPDRRRTRTRPMSISPPAPILTRCVSISTPICARGWKERWGFM